MIVHWSAGGPNEARAQVLVGSERVGLHLQVDAAEALQSMWLSRWGNPDGGEHRFARFGGVVERHGTFAGFTIPIRMRIGWYFGTDRFDQEGEFFRVTIDEATYRPSHCRIYGHETIRK